MAEYTLRVFRGDAKGGQEHEYRVQAEEGWVVLDAIHAIQRQQDGSLACRWNCKAAKCGSCSAEINGIPSLMCKTRLDALPPGPIRVYPIKTFPLIRDLVTDVSWNYEQAKKIQPFTYDPKIGDQPFRIRQRDVARIQEFRKCIECFLCQNVCHVLREHQLKDHYFGPRQMIRLAALEMHPMDIANRAEMIWQEAGVGYCNITKCCEEVCPESIRITDNGIIPLKERVIDSRGLLRVLRGLVRRRTE
ncbi:MAG: fumarate reductase iron-sulfur subunit [Fimbriimonadales bacterium]